MFKDRKGRIIGDVKIPGVDGDFQNKNAMDPQEELVQPELLAPNDDSDNPELPELQDEAENNNDLEADEPTAAPEVLPGEDIANAVEPTPPKIEQPTDAAVAPEPSPGVRRSTRVKFQTREPHVPSMTGSKCAVAVMQLEDHGALHPDLHVAFLWTACI